LSAPFYVQKPVKPEERDDAVILQPAGKPEAAVIWLHGLGADGHDFVPIVEELDLPAGVPVRFVFPHAPVRAVAINAGTRMRAWYDIAPDMRRQDEAGIRESAAVVEGYLQREQDAGIPSQRIVLAGFSQGGAITLHTGLRYARPLAGLLALSTYVPLPERFAAEARRERADTPILMCHGQHDPMLPLSLGAWSRDLLREHGYAVDWREYPMAHQVCMEEIADIGAWLRERLATKAKKGSDQFSGATQDAAPE
jgi:phospholipase/carboxylesterase